MVNFSTGLQKIPPSIETARKFYKNYFGGDPRRIHKRQVLGDYFDVILMVDSSSSVSTGEFKRGLMALEQLVHKSRNETSYATIAFATRATIAFNFTEARNAEGKLRALKRSGGKTNTQDALRLCKEMFVDEQYGVRQGSFRRILIVTDGQSNIRRTETTPRALELKFLGIEVFVIAVGEFLPGIKELAEMASSTDAHMYRVQSMSGFMEIVKLIPDVSSKPWFEQVFGETLKNGDEDSGPLGKLK